MNFYCADHKNGIWTFAVFRVGRHRSYFCWLRAAAANNLPERHKKRARHKTELAVHSVNLARSVSMRSFRIHFTHLFLSISPPSPPRVCHGLLDAASVPRTPLHLFHEKLSKRSVEISIKIILSFFLLAVRSEKGSAGGEGGGFFE